MNKSSKILLVGHNDIIEQSLLKYFQSHGFEQAISSSEIALNPTIQPSVYDYFQKHRPEYVFLGSTRSGGIEANQKNPAEFLYHNLESQNNILYAARKFGVKKLLFFASSCVYPRDCPQPMKEEYLLTGPLEETSEPYSVAKIAGIKLCQSYKKQYGFNAITMIPATVYGPDTDIYSKTAHVIGALAGKFVKAAEENQPQVTVWGTGRPKREFLFADDFVEAALFLMNHYNGEKIINAGGGTDVSIQELAKMIAAVTGFQGKILFDGSKPDGVMQKLLDNTRITQLGWKAKTPLKEGIQKIFIHNR